MTQQMGQLFAASCPFIAFLQPNTLGLGDFQAVLLLLQQNWKYKVVHIQAYLPCLDIRVEQNSRSGHVSRNSVNHFQVAI
jgi:hypothetical protein